MSGSQLEIRTAQLNIAQYTQQDVTPLATIPSDVTQVVIPTDNAWPRYIFTVTTTTEDQQAKRLLVMRQESARQNYKLWAVARLLEDVSLPGFAPAKQGNVMGDANDSNLVMTPSRRCSDTPMCCRTTRTANTREASRMTSSASR